MNSDLDPHIQLAINSVMGLLDAYELNIMDFEALSAVDILDYLKDFEMARPHLDFLKYRRLTTLQQSLIAHLDEK
jgi:hypothetical protein